MLNGYGRFCAIGDEDKKRAAALEEEQKAAHAASIQKNTHVIKKEPTWREKVAGYIPSPTGLLAATAGLATIAALKHLVSNDRRRLQSLELQRRALAAVAHMEAQDVNAMSPAERVMHRRNLADANSMAAKDVHAMSPSELITHRRRLTYGPRVNLVMAELMDKCLDAKKRHDGR